MKKAFIGFAIGWAVGIASTIIGLRGYANDPIILQEIRVAIPGVGQTIGLALKGSAFIWLGAFFLGLMLFSIIWVINEIRRKKRA